MTLVMPKAHYDAYAFNMPDDVYEKLFLAGKKVAKLLDKKLNTELNRKEAKISTENSKVPIYIIPTNEELVIALDTEMIIKGEAVDY